MEDTEEAGKVAGGVTSEWLKQVKNQTRDNIVWADEKAGPGL